MGQVKRKLSAIEIFTNGLQPFLIIRISAIYSAKIHIFLDKNAKNAIKKMKFDRNLGILTQFSNIFIIFASKFYIY